jgi:hypothetical protein
VLPGADHHGVLDIGHNNLRPHNLLINAMQINAPGRARLVEMLLQRGPPPLEETCYSGGTALNLAARDDDAEVGFGGQLQLQLARVLCDTRSQQIWCMDA